MTRTRMMLWTALALGSGLRALADAQQSYQPPATGNDIQLYSRPLQEEQTEPALPETQRQRPAADSQPIPKMRYEDLPPERAAPDLDQQPIPKMRYEDLPPEHAAPAPNRQPIPKTGYEDKPPPPATRMPPPDLDEETVDLDESPPGGLLEIQNYRGIRYVSGGVGEGERAELNALSSRFNLRLLFAMQGSGSYVADVRVKVRDDRGEWALVAESKGPWFLAELPPGTYSVEAEALGQSQRQTARIGGARQPRLNFYWR